MKGRVCVVTGANSGIGKETARAIARRGATVVLACRNVEAGNAARDEIAAQTGNPDLEVLRLDLASHASVRGFAAEFAAKHLRLHVLVNNAGIYTATHRITPDGVESTFASNHLGHFLLTSLLLDKLKASAPARIVNVASEASRWGAIHFDDLNLEKRWSGFQAYNQSKLANILFTAEVARRLAGTGVTANAVHPGGVRTNWARRGAGAMGVAVRLFSPFMIPAAKGADTVAWLASSPEVDGASGGYYHKRKRIAPNPVAEDPQVALRLWDVSARLAGIPS